MAYEKLNLRNGQKLDENHLAHMEEGIASAAPSDHKHTAADVGAAAAGYGYGEAVINTGSMFADESALNAALDTLLGTMANNETKQFRFSISTVGDITVGDWAWKGTLFRPSDNYATLTAESSFGNRVTVISKARASGSWYPWEWVNPPMLVGREYRTTERYYGKAVYTAAINLGTLPASGEKGTTYTTTASTAVVSLAAYAKSSSGTINMFPFYNSSGVLQGKASATSSKVYIDAFKDMSTNTGYAIIKYTKD